MSFTVAITGRPNVGKSTFFKAATMADVLIANYPFATIKPNHGKAYIKIKDYLFTASLMEPNYITLFHYLIQKHETNYLTQDCWIKLRYLK